MKITRTFNVPDDLIRELACAVVTAAIEGGIAYWGSVSHYRWGDSTLGHSHKQADGTRMWKDGDKPYATATIEEDEGNHIYKINVDIMIAALVKIGTGDAVPFGALGYDESFAIRVAELFAQADRNPHLRFLDADFDFDSSDADSAVQFALFGDVIYG